METERLILRLYEDDDYENFIKLFTDGKVMKFVDTGVFSPAKAQSLWQKLTVNFYPNGIKTIYGVFAKNGGDHVGTASIRPRPTNLDEWEITYILEEEAWGKGYATEIAGRLVKFGFDELNLAAVYATVDTDNSASIRVLEKIGMKHIRDEYDEQGRFYIYGVRLKSTS